jgi:hypothetical protein
MSSVAGRPHWEATIEWVCENHGDRVEKVFAALNLEHEGLSAVKDAWNSGERVAACRALIAYYDAKANKTGRVLEPVAQTTETSPEAEQILNDTFTFQNVTGTAPQQQDGSLEWTHRGPNDDQEWAFSLNRHGHLGALLGAYQETGNRAYVQRIDAHIREWVLVNPYPGKHTDDPRWRGLETMARIHGWGNIFYALAENEALQPGTKILVLSSMPDHAHYTRHFHDKGGNWLAMQMSALAHSALEWPEYRDADSWMNYATATLSPELEKQVYPDGVQKELASHYHGVTRYSFQQFAGLLERAGCEVPAGWHEVLDRMWNYSAYSLRPDGHGVLNNDSNLDFNRPGVLEAADRFDRPDWAFIATNGQQGQNPDGPPSKIFPWAGQMVMRSGWGSDAHWGFFDIGPWGTGHQHYDKLHLSVSAFGRDILVDAGRLYYKRDRWRDFILSTAAHNAVLIDGNGQKEDVKEVTQPLDASTYQIAENLDYARGTFTAGYYDIDGEAAHTRALVYVRGKFWVVVDRVETDRPRQIQALWHFHPDCAVEIQGGTAASIDAQKGNVRVVPVGDPDWAVEIIEGQEEPSIQGWYSREYNVKQASPCAVYSTKTDGTATFAWVIVPARGAVPSAQTELLDVTDDDATVRVCLEGEDMTVHVPIATGEPEIR